MKRIILSTLLSLIAGAAFAQDMTTEQLKALQEKAMELYPSNESQRSSWISKQKNAFESIKFVNYNLSEAEMDAIKKDAQDRFPNDYLEQEEHIRSQADAIVNLNFFSKGIDPEEFNAIKAIVAKESNANADEYISLIQIHLDSKNRLNDMPIPEGVDILDFNILKRITNKYYPFNYKKQFEEVQTKLDFLASISASRNASDRNDPAAYSNIGLALLEKHTLKTSDADAKLAIAVKFKGKLGFLCPISAYRDDFELLTPLGDTVEIEKIHVSKTAPIIFVEVNRFPSGIETIEIESLENIKTKLSKPLTLAGYFSTTKPSAFKTSITAIRDNNYIMSNKTPFSFTDGTMLLDYEDAKLLSFTIRDGAKKKTIPDFSDKAKAIATMRSSISARANTDATYPILDNLEVFEILSPAKMKSQQEFLHNLTDDNIEALKLYTATSLGSLASSKKFGKIARDNATKFKNKLGESAFQKEAKSLMTKLINQLKADFETVDPNNFYINIREELIYQMALREKLIEYYQEAFRNDLDSILPRDITSARAEPQQQNKSGKKGSSSRSSSNSLISSPL